MALGLYGIGRASWRWHERLGVFHVLARASLFVAFWSVVALFSAGVWRVAQALYGYMA